MPIPILNQPGGYSWLGVSVPGNVGVKAEGLTNDQKKKLDQDCDHIESSLLYFENKIHRYNSLCKQYSKLAETAKAGGLLRQMEVLREEIDHLADRISKTLDDTELITHSNIIKKKEGNNVSYLEK